MRLANAMLAAAAVLLVVVAPAAAAGQAQGAAGTILFTSGNDLGVENGPRRPTVFKLGQTTTITSVLDYHWNGGRGAAPGEIALRRAEDGKQFGPWQAVAQQPALPVNWIVYPHLTVKPGTYTILDSDPATWAQNAASGNRGMSFVRAPPHSPLRKLKQAREVVQARRRRGMLRAERLLDDRQRPLVKRLRPGVVPLRLKQVSEVVEARRRIGMLRAERLLADRQRPLVKRLRPRIVPL